MRSRTLALGLLLAALAGFVVWHARSSREPDAIVALAPEGSSGDSSAAIGRELDVQGDSDLSRAALAKSLERTPDEASVATANPAEEAALTVTISGGEVEGRVEIAPQSGRGRSVHEFGPGAMSARVEGLRTEPCRLKIVRLPEGWVANHDEFHSEGAAGRRIDLACGENEIELRVERIARVLGSVREPSGRPIDGADVSLLPLGTPGRSISVRTIVGEFDAALGSGTWLAQVTRVERAGCALPEPRLVLVDPGSELRIDFVCLPGTRAVRGKLVDEAGVPIVWVEIDIRRPLSLVARMDVPLPKYSGSASPSDLTDAEGRFEFTSLAAAVHRLELGTSHYDPFTTPGRAIHVLGEPIPPRMIDLTLSDAGDLVIVAKRGQPIRIRGTFACAGERFPRVWLYGEVGAIDVLDRPRRVERSRALAIDAAGAFDAWIDARATNVRIEAVLDGVEREYPLSDGGRIQDLGPRTLRFP